MARSRIDEGAVHALAAARIAFGGLLLAQTATMASELATEGYFGDHFHWSVLPERFVLGERAYTLLLCVMCVGSVLAIVGHLARPALAFCALATIYVLLCDRLHFHHNRYALACYAFLVALGPCDRAFALGSEGLAPSERWKGLAVGPLWAQRLGRIQVSIVYLASGASKLLDPDWRGGAVLLDRMVRHAHEAIDRGVPERVVTFFGQASVASVLSKGAIATELFLAFALLSRRTRIAALAVGFYFHLAIEVTSKVELFSLTTFAAYFLFATPDARARKLTFDPTRRKAIAMGRFVKTFDWLARFEVKPWAADGLSQSRSFVVRDRDGVPLTGFRGVLVIMRCLPITFPIWAVLWPFVRKWSLK